MWHIEQNGQSAGPFTDDQLKAMVEAKSVTAATLAWQPGFAGWRPLGETDFVHKGLLAPPPMMAPGAPYAVPGPVNGTGENLSVWGYFWRCVTSYYVQFHGRARLKEFWSYQLFATLIFLAMLAIGIAVDLALGNVTLNTQADHKDAPIAVGIAFLVYYLPFFLPGLAVRIRRLHDLNISGWMYLIGLIPYLGLLVLFVMSLIPTQLYANKHGLPPV